MKNVLMFACVALLVLAALIIYLGLQRESIINPPVITGVGFIIIAVVFALFSRRT